MSAKILLEKRAILLQKIAFELLTNPKVKLSAVENLIGDPSIFDKDMTNILSLLYSHNNLVSETLTVTSYPSAILVAIRDSLESRGFKLPSFRRRFEWIKNKSGGSFRNEVPDSKGGIQALDKSLRRIVEKLYELRLHDSAHLRNTNSVVVTKHSGAVLVKLAEELISVVKKLSADYQVADDSVRVTSNRSPEMDKRYDEVAAMLNSSTRTSAEGPRIELLNVSSPLLEGDDRWYCVHTNFLSGLGQALERTHKDWTLNDPANLRYEYVEDLVNPLNNYKVSVTFGSFDKNKIEDFLSTFSERSTLDYEWEPYKDGERVTITDSALSSLVIEHIVKSLTEEGGEASLIQGLKSAKQAEEATKLILSVGGVAGDAGKEVIRLVRLPFAPDEMDEWPAAELWKEKFINKYCTLLTLELILKTRFSGFVDFDEKYRMIILWANASSDDVKGINGSTFREILVSLLTENKSELASILGQAPEVMKTKNGAAFYFPKPASLVRVIKSRQKLEYAIENINNLLSDEEKLTALSRGFNSNLDDDEFPSPLEEPS